MPPSEKDRRKFERVEVDTQAVVEFEGQDVWLKLNLRDISDGGAFIETSQPLREGESLKVEVEIPSEAISELKKADPTLKGSGKIIRTESGGIAVSFSRPPDADEKD